MNLFIGVTLDGFQAANNKDYTLITSDDFEVFREKWAEFDPSATSLVTVKRSQL